MDTVGSDVLSFDYYPFRESAESDPYTLQGMLENMSDIALCAKEYDVPAWGFVQNSSWRGTRIPDENELRFISHMHLLFGLKSYSYFLYCQPADMPGAEGVFEGMLTYEKGERTDIYYRVQKNNKALTAMRGRFLTYDFQGLYTDRLPIEYATAVDAKLKLQMDGALENIVCDGSLLTGYYKNQENSAYYVLNFDYKNATSVTVRFRENTDKNRFCGSISVIII